MKRYGYGPISADAPAINMPVAASQMIAPNGDHFVVLNTAGHVVLAVTASTYLFGWALFPTSLKPGSTDASNGYWTGSATAGAESVGVISKLDVLYRAYSATMARASVGRTADIVGVVNDGSRQYVNVGTETNDLLLLMDIVDTSTTECICRLNPLKVQALTS